MVAARDLFFMRKALQVAERGRGRTSPNPMVGALVVDHEGVIVGRGAHEVAGGPHAEVLALNDAAGRAQGATLYCTLEPCSHTGRTGPCAPLVVAAGIARVVVATPDPNPLVAGKGLELLRDRGLEVRTGVLDREAELLNGPFFSVMTRQRPFVTMKIATSQDGRIAARTGERAFLTGAAANRHVHRERAEADALAVGSGTVLCDDPHLTPRGAFRARPLARVIFDRSLRTPPTARIFNTLDAGPVIIVASRTERDPPPDRARRLMDAGAEIATADNGAVSSALRLLAGRGISSLILEGGTRIHQAFWDAGAVDRVQVYVAPIRLGTRGVPWLQVPVLDSPLIAARTARMLGPDMLFEAYVHRVD